MAITDLALPHMRDGSILSGPRRGVITDATMSRLMKRRGLSARPHGFRSSLRTSLAEATDAAFELEETMIAHRAGTRTLRAYQRTDYLDQRRRLMERWAMHVTGASETQSKKDKADHG